eukprot:XP_016856384.1 carbonic anhydrase 14 isoform X8 [Homo sapiens]
MLFSALLLEVIWILAADGGQHWTYEGPHGQDHWPASYPECGNNAQSPIDIQTDSVTFDPDLPALQPHGYDQPGTEPLDLHNNGHTVQLSLPSTLYLGGLPRKYVAAQLHLHWGQKGSPGGSEHQINSEATFAELHIVHYDSDSYDSLSEAAERPQGLAVLGILIELEKLQGTLFSTEEEPSKLLVQNYRALQPLNQRMVFASFIQAGSSYTTGRRGWKTERVWSSPQHKPRLRHKFLLRYHGCG